MGLRTVSVDQIVNASGVAAIPVASTAVVYSKAFKLEYAEKFALQYQAGSSGADAIDIKIELEQGNVEPATEGASDGNFVTVDGGSAIVASVTTKTVHIIALAPVVSKYARLKLTGAAGNSATATLNAKLAKVEDL